MRAFNKGFLSIAILTLPLGSAIENSYAAVDIEYPADFCKSNFVNNIPLVINPPVEGSGINLRKEEAQLSNRDKASVCGRWEAVYPRADGAAVDNILGMQTVHSALLPSGKLLLASGSSWRNKFDVDRFPDSLNPVPGTGLFDVREDPFANSKYDNYYRLVNNTAIYDPVANSFYRIPSPLPEKGKDTFLANDLFCSGHVHLPDGNVLFVGGTEYYYPYRTGAQSNYIFDWRKELTVDWKSVDWSVVPEKNDAHYLWTFAGKMDVGRWYPSLVPLNDGRISIFSGFTNYFLTPKVTAYRFEINSTVDFFDPYRFNPDHPENAWKNVDVKETPNSPFSTRIYKTFTPSVCEDMEHFDALGISTNPDADPTLKPPCTCDERCQKDNLYDAFKLYPNNYQLANNRIYLSREGDWVSLRTSDTAYMRRTKNTYWVNIEGDAEHPKVTFEHGPDRPDIITSYGTSYFDPNFNGVGILGGQPVSPGTSTSFITVLHDDENPDYDFSNDSSDSSTPEKIIATRFHGGLGSTKFETFHPDGDNKSGQWKIEPNFLGDHAQDNRTMGAAIVLPTRQVLLINGGNYDFYGPIHYPVLMTPEFNDKGEFVQYHSRRLTDAVEPRLYHNSAVLLPDGRVWTSGGNSARASVNTKEGVQPTSSKKEAPKGQRKPNLDLVNIKMYFFQDGQMAEVQKGMLDTPTENWTAEIFNPPYLFIGGDYRPQIETIKQTSKAKPGTTFQQTIGKQNYYLLQSRQSYEVEVNDLPKEHKQNDELVLIKLPSFTHDWDQGHKFISIPFDKKTCAKSSCVISFQTPEFVKANIPPAFYMMFYVDTQGKPSKAAFVRLDDKAVAP
ncbi:hypothetical protein BTA51_14730 [Hahella sp. CCB-MM4]|uniref:galactose oxidase-like domain-containing protein n=1 Tax=Hahella sp. (strain CCB-MM4) TaxID=1926491 RepID=UPI000B9A5FA5|nr:galactose oxidase-like domain-containing protein [Hahella sp. CCB-MM4]OZG72773.1 hypothetical protein BTA51_14730 [Hahella sp. CCB-MM4]